MSGKISKIMTRGLQLSCGAGRLRKISIPTRIQEVIIHEGGMTRYQYCLWPLYIETNNRQL